MIQMLVSNLVVVVFVFSLLRGKWRMNSSVMKQLGLLELSWICFLLMTGFYYVFSILEAKTTDQTFTDAIDQEMIQGFYVLGIFLLIHLTLFALIIWRVATVLKQETKKGAPGSLFSISN
jgi:hypothetical protein